MDQDSLLQVLPPLSEDRWPAPLPCPGPGGVLAKATTLTCICDSNAPGRLAGLGLTGTGAGKEAGGYGTAAPAGTAPAAPGRT